MLTLTSTRVEGRIETISFLKFFVFLSHVISIRQRSAAYSTTELFLKQTVRCME